MAGRIAYTGGIVRDGLVLLLDAAKRDSYTDSGTTWRDLSGNGNNGTLTNGSTFNSDNNGSIVFDGTNDYVSVSNSTTINPNTGSFTIICWVNSDPSVSGDGWDLWIAKRINSWNGYYLGCNSPSGVRFMTGNSDGMRADTPYIDYTYNTWAMFTATLDNVANIQTVIRNNFEQTASVASWGGNYYNNGVLSIGGDIGMGQFFTNGKQSSIYFYNRVLSATEITQNFNALRGRYGI